MNIHGSRFALAFAAWLVVGAEPATAGVETTCQRQAQAVVEDLRDRLPARFTPSEQDIVRAAVLSACAESTASVRATANDAEAPTRSMEETDKTASEKDDWFTRYLLEGEAPRKAGNKRLKRRSSH